MIFDYLYWFQIFKDQWGSVPSIPVAVLGQPNRKAPSKKCMPCTFFCTSPQYGKCYSLYAASFFLSNHFLAFYYII